MNTSDYRNAPSGEGPLAAEWKDKPHRLVYDLCAEIERERKPMSRKAEIRQLCDERAQEACKTLGMRSWYEEANNVLTKAEYDEVSELWASQSIPGTFCWNDSFFEWMNEGVKFIEWKERRELRKSLPAGFQKFSQVSYEYHIRFYFDKPSDIIVYPRMSDNDQLTDTEIKFFIERLIADNYSDRAHLGYHIESIIVFKLERTAYKQHQFKG